MKFVIPPARKSGRSFWLDLGPASAYEGLDCCETARRDGDASRTASPTALRARKARKTSCPRPMTTRTVSRCPTCRPS